MPPFTPSFGGPLSFQRVNPLMGMGKPHRLNVPVGGDLFARSPCTQPKGASKYSIRGRGMRVLFVLVLVLLAAPAHSEIMRRFKVGNWDAGSYSDSSASFSHCAANATYRSNVTVYFAIDKGFNWAIGFSHPNWRYVEGQQLQITFTVDNLPPMTANAVAISEKAVKASLPDSVELFKLFRRGKILRVAGTKSVFEFLLTGTELLLPALARCVAQRGNAPSPVAVNTSTDAAPSVPSPPKSSEPKGPSSGSGFLISTDGHVVTAAHVVAGCNVVTIPKIGTARIIAQDKNNDLALLQVAAPAGISPLKLRGRPIRLGEDVISLGFPLRGLLGGLNVTTGMISAMSGLENDSSRIQFTAAVQPGNSGGALLDRSGSVTGVVTSRLNDSTMLKVAGALPQNVNFAIRKDVVLAFIQAQGVAVETTNESAERPVADIVEQRREALFPIECR